MTPPCRTTGPLVLSLLRTRPEEWKAKREQKPNKKMIGWLLSELTYNDNLRERMGMEAPLDVAEVNLNAHHVYTDGSFTGFRNIHKSRWRDRAKKKGGGGQCYLQCGQGGMGCNLLCQRTSA